MANPNPQPKRAKKGPELAQRVRTSLLNALDVMDKRGKPISELLADELEENPIRFMELASKYCPKEVEADVTIDLPAKIVIELVGE